MPRLSLALIGLFLILFPVLSGTASIREERVPRIAAICTVYYPASHADVIVTRFLAGYPTDDGLVTPRVKIVSMYIDDIRENDPVHPDIGPKMAAKYGIPLYPTIREALTLGGNKLAVDGVLYIGEHGYPLFSRFGSKMYPHLRHMEEIFRVMDSSKCAVPVYCDKQFAYSWLDSKWIYDRALDLGAPLMGGSCLPLGWESHAMKIKPGSRITEAVSVGPLDLDQYGFHQMELLLSVLELRRGGESGVASVETLKGTALFRAIGEGRISTDLVEAALDRCPKRPKGTLEENDPEAVGVIVRHRDGTRSAFIVADNSGGWSWACAARVNGKVQASEFELPHAPFNAFSYLSMNIERMFLTGQVQWPAERTLLASSVIDAANRSAALGAALKTPWLGFRYKPLGVEVIRPTAADPAAWPLSRWNPWPEGKAPDYE